MKSIYKNLIIAIDFIFWVFISTFASIAYFIFNLNFKIFFLFAVMLFVVYSVLGFMVYAILIISRNKGVAVDFEGYRLCAFCWIIKKVHNSLLI